MNAKSKFINETTSSSTTTMLNQTNDDYLNSWRYEKNTNLYQRNPTEETLITGKDNIWNFNTILLGAK